MSSEMLENVGYIMAGICLKIANTIDDGEEWVRPIKPYELNAMAEVAIKTYVATIANEVVSTSATIKAMKVMENESDFRALAVAATLAKFGEFKSISTQEELNKYFYDIKIDSFKEFQSHFNNLTLIKCSKS